MFRKCLALAAAGLGLSCGCSSSSSPRFTCDDRPGFFERLCGRTRTRAVPVVETGFPVDYAGGPILVDRGDGVVIPNAVMPGVTFPPGVQPGAPNVGPPPRIVPVPNPDGNAVPQAYQPVRR